MMATAVTAAAVPSRARSIHARSCLRHRRAVAVPSRRGTPSDKPAWTVGGPAQGGHRGGVAVPRTAETSEASTADPQEAAAAGGATFNWTKQWYPVAPISTLDPARPHSTELLGQRLVVWRDGDGEWQCFQDRCPHRLAPLSEGRLEGGKLSCAYHGWEFDSDGACARIPQAESAAVAATAIASKRSCAVRHPAQVSHGLLFVWGEGGPVAQVEAAAAPVACAVPELVHPEHGDKYTFISQWFTGTVPYGYDTLVENVVDPSHVPFSHHGVQGDRTKAGKDVMSMIGKVTPDGGFLVERANEITGLGKGTAKEGEGPDQTIAFLPPSLVQYRNGGTTPEGMTKFNMAVFAVPVRPGTSRIIFALFTSMQSPLLKLFALKPTFLDHLTRLEVLSGDNVFLHAQERELRRTAPAETFAKQFYMPASCDTAVIAFRRWFHSMAGNGIPYAEGVSPELPPLVTDRSVLLDRWNQHSAHCPACRSAHRNLGIAAVAAAAVAAALFLGLAASLGAGASEATVTLLGGSITVLASTLRNFLLGAGIALCCFAAKVAKDLQQKLVFVDYVHADRG